MEYYLSTWWYFLLTHCRAAKLGQEFRDQLQKVQQKFPQIIREVRGRGLLNAVDLNNDALSPASAYDICIKLKERGILAKPTHDTIIRLAPPLSIRYDPSPKYFMVTPLFIHMVVWLYVRNQKLSADWYLNHTPYMVFSPEELAEASKALSDVLEHDLPQMQKQIKKPESEAEKPVCDRCGRDLHGWVKPPNRDSCILVGTHLALKEITEQGILAN